MYCSMTISKKHSFFQFRNYYSTGLAIDVRLEIEILNNLTGITAYCLLILVRIIEYVPLIVRRLV